MNLSKKALEEFKKIWKEEKGQELEDVVASFIEITTRYPLREGGL